MADFNVRSDSVNVEQIMEQIRSRIRDKRGVDYTEDQIRELATVKLERFLDPRGVRSDLLEQFRRSQPPPPPLTVPLYPFEDTTLFDSHRGFVRFFRRLFRPLLMLFFNSNALAHSLHAQTVINKQTVDRLEALEASLRQRGDLYYELLHNLVIELTRTTIEAKNVKMRVESIASRLEFNERRARALEGMVVYRPAEEEREERAAASPPPRGSSSGAPRESQRQPQRPPQSSAVSSPPISSPGASGSPAPSGLQTSLGGQTSPGAQTSAGAQTPGSPAAPVSPALPAPVPQPAGPTSPGTAAEGPGQRSRRRRRRRGRRGGASAAELMTPSGRATHMAEGAPAHGVDPAATRVESPVSPVEAAPPASPVQTGHGGQRDGQADAQTPGEPPEHAAGSTADPAGPRDKPTEAPAAPSSSPPTPAADRAADRHDDGQ